MNSTFHPSVIKRKRLARRRAKGRKLLITV